jgi:hypothetical protein
MSADFFNKLLKSWVIKRSWLNGEWPTSAREIERDAIVLGASLSVFHFLDIPGAEGIPFVAIDNQAIQERSGEAASIHDDMSPITGDRQE